MALIKTPEDIDAIIVGGKRLGEVLERLIPFVVPGVSTEELNAYAMEWIEEKGDKASFHGYTPEGAPRPYPAALCVSVNEEVVHGIPNENPRILKDGDIVTLDCGLIHKGRFVDSALSLPVGNVEQRYLDLMSATQASLEAAIRVVMPGNHVGDIGAAVIDSVQDSPFGIVQELGGHGVGHAVHEEPYIPNVGDVGDGEELLEGMVIAIEPILVEGSPRVKLLKDGYTYVTKDGGRAAHFEHTMVVTSDGPRVVTRRPSEL